MKYNVPYDLGLSVVLVNYGAEVGGGQAQVSDSPVADEMPDRSAIHEKAWVRVGVSFSQLNVDRTFSGSFETERIAWIFPLRAGDWMLLFPAEEALFVPDS